MLVTPIIKAFKSSLDANNDILIEFYSRGGDQVAKNEIEIYDTETNILTHTDIVVSFNLKHTVPAKSLVNGKRYKVRLRTYNIDDDKSSWSDFINFKCSSTPVIILNSIADNTVKNQTYLFSGTYTQAENEPIQSFRFIVYDRYRNQLNTSPEMYSNIIEYEFTGFNNDENYYIEIKAKSSGNIEVSTGLIGFYVKYLQPKMRTVLKLENNEEKATVSVEVNPIQVIFNSTNGSYSFENSFINLATDKIYTDKSLGFALNGDSWTINLRFKVFENTSNILVLTSMDGNKIVVLIKEDRLFVRYFYGDTLLITKFHDISSTVANNSVLNLYIQKNKYDLITDLKIN